ncbi:MAG: MCP four helix bundle domain-containing protein [Planctomycetes bacterium]|nr:MCP four helix bundle domain-containing protein [Planctomycetota bacterium]
MSNSIRNRLLFLSTAGSVLAVAIAATAFWVVGNLHSDSERATNDLSAVRNLMQGDMCHDALRADALAALLGATGRGATRDQIQADVSEHASDFRSAMAELDALEMSDGERAALTAVGPDLTAYIAAAESIVETAYTHPERADQAMLEFDTAFKRLESSLGELGDQLEGAAVEHEQAAAERFATASTLIATLLGVGTALAIGLALFGTWAARGISVPLTNAIALLRRVAERDFTPRMAAQGDAQMAEMAASLNQALESVQNALTEVRGEASELASVAGAISDGSRRLSDGSQNQASALEETAASLEEITGTVKQNADSAKQASQLASSSQQTAERGGAVVGEAVASIREISESSKRIAAITSTIDEIAFQTNLLALNAAVEAARAGEQGRGFAVVASEVRNLAQRSAQAAKEIKTLIEESVGKIEKGTELVDRSGRSLEEIVGSVKRVNQIIAEIASASQEQSIGVEQVNRAVTQMDQTVQATASQTGELASSASTLADQAKRLQALVDRFRLNDSGVRAPTPRSSAPAPMPKRPQPAPRASVPSPTRRSEPAAAVAASSESDDGFIEM